MVDHYISLSANNCILIFHVIARESMEQFNRLWSCIFKANDLGGVASDVTHEIHAIALSLTFNSPFLHQSNYTFMCASYNNLP